MRQEGRRCGSARVGRIKSIGGRAITGLGLLPIAECRCNIKQEVVVMSQRKGPGQAEDCNSVEWCRG
jgi:hypothetical protein